MSLIFHITDAAQWQAAQIAGAYSHPSLEAEGFIHCSKAEQVVWVANQFFQGQTDLLLLGIDCDLLQAELRYEPVPGVGSFPHVYGAINLDAVVQVLPFVPNQTGEFELPNEIA
jgi:uncharacterized protein (DUF952 family)